MESPVITYLLGAGASRNTIPIVQDFSKDLSSMAITVRNHCVQNADNLQLMDRLNWLSKEAEDFVTVDTFAKKLFLNDEINELNDLKRTLGIYFLLKQFAKIDQNEPLRKPIIDKRYIPLVSAFLQRQGEKIILPNNLNFISWNYDLQLELALESFITKRHSSFIYTLRDFKSYPGNMDHDLPNIVHLNGVTGVYTKLGGVLRHLVDEIHDGNIKHILERITPAFNFVYSDKSEAINATLLPTFAWEGNEPANQAVKYAENIISQTDYLVIIGYSFPVFNHDIDKIIFQKSPRIKKIFLQNPNADKNAFATTFGVDLSKVYEMKNVDQFFIPLQA